MWNMSRLYLPAYCCCAAVSSESIFSILTKASCSLLTAEEIAWLPFLKNKLFIANYNLLKFMYLLIPSQVGAPFLHIKVIYHLRHNRSSGLCSKLTLETCTSIKSMSGRRHPWHPMISSRAGTIDKGKIILLPPVIIQNTSWYNLRVHTSNGLCCDCINSELDTIISGVRMADCSIKHLRFCENCRKEVTYPVHKKHKEEFYDYYKK